MERLDRLREYEKVGSFCSFSALQLLVQAWEAKREV